jgi:hypothetical protein
VHRTANEGQFSIGARMLPPRGSAACTPFPPTVAAIMTTMSSSEEGFNRNVNAEWFDEVPIRQDEDQPAQPADELVPTRHVLVH